MKRTTTLLILVTALAAALRLCGLTHQSFWEDEAFSVYAARGVDMRFMSASLVDATHRRFVNPRPTLRRVVEACLRNEGTPPAYYAALALWIRLFGGGEFACRALSAAAGVLAVPAVYLAGLRIFRRKDTALLAALLLAVSPAAIFFSQEARAYSAANLLVLLSSWLFLRALDEGRRFGPWAAYALSALLLCYTFYFACLALVAHGIFAAARRRGVWPWLCSMAAVGILYLPWLAVGFRMQLMVSSSYSRPGPAGVPEFLRASLRGLRYVLDSLLFGPMHSRVFITVPVKRAVWIGMAALLACGTGRLWRAGARRAAAFPLLLAAVPLAAVFALGAARWTLWYMKPRYHLWESAGLLLLAAGAIATFRRKWVRAALAAAICLFSLAAAPYHFYPGALASDHAKEDFRGAAAIISAREERGDLILVNIPGHMIPLNYYYRGGLRQVGLAECGRYDLAEQLERYARGRRRIWALIGGGTRGHGDQEIAAFLNARFLAKEKFPLRGIDLTLYARPGPGNGPR